MQMKKEQIYRHRNPTCLVPYIHKQKKLSLFSQTFIFSTQPTQAVMHFFFFAEVYFFIFSKVHFAAVCTHYAINFQSKKFKFKIPQPRANHNNFSASNDFRSEMATAKNSAQAQRAVIYSLWKCGKRGTDIHLGICLSRSTKTTHYASPNRENQWCCKEFREEE